VAFPFPLRGQQHDLRGRPDYPPSTTLVCVINRFTSGAMPAWEFERNAEVVKVDPGGPLSSVSTLQPILLSLLKSH